jgi:polysaccharide biosynthesis transport protein
MEKTPAFDPLDYVSVLRRRIWWLAVPIVLAAIVGVVLVKYLPRTYETTATMGVALPAMSQELVAGQRVTPEERMRNIQQVLASPAVLERVAREERLDKTMPIAQAMNLVRSRINLSMPKPDPNLPPGSFNQFYLTYTDATPANAQRLANKIADTFVEESSHKREVRAEETSAFISRQVQGSQMRLSELEGRLRVAKEAFMGALPEQTNANVAMVTGLQQQLETSVNALRGEQDRLSLIERQIDTMKAGATAVSIPGTPTPSSASPATVRAVQLERELASARNTYTDKHPEVVRLREELAAAKAEAIAEAQKPEEARVATLAVDPAYQSLLKERAEVRLRIGQLQRQQADLQGQISMYRNRVESAPRVEQQIATLQREYDLEREQYSQLTTRMRNAEMAENVVRNRGGEEFTVLQHAPLPDTPATPNVQRLLMMVLLLGLVLGAGAALGREYLDRSIYDARSLNDLELPVLGEIPRIAQA